MFIPKTLSIRKDEIRLSEVQRKTGAEPVYNGIVGPNLGRHLLFCSQIPSHNAIRNEFDTSLSMNFGKANITDSVVSCFFLSI